MVNGGEMGECYGYSEVQDRLMAGFWGEGMQKNASSAEKIERAHRLCIHFI